MLWRKRESELQNRLNSCAPHVWLLILGRAGCTQQSFANAFASGQDTRLEQRQLNVVSQLIIQVHITIPS